MFGETTISYVEIGNHPIETTIYKWLFGVPGCLQGLSTIPDGWLAGISEPSTVSAGWKASKICGEWEARKNLSD